MARTRIEINTARRFLIVALGECSREVQQGVGVVGCGCTRAPIEIDGVVDVPALARDPGQRPDRAQVGFERERAPERFARAGIISEIKQDHA